MKFTLSLFNDLRDTVPKTAEYSWDDLCQRLAHPKVGVQQIAGLFSPASFREPRRLQESVVELSMLVLDCDHSVTLDELIRGLRSVGCAFIIYSTFSHKRLTPKNPNGEERYRAVIPLSTPIPANGYRALWRWGASLEGVHADEQTKDLHRMYYGPVIASAEAPYDFYVEGGKFLDWRALCLAPDAEAKDTRRDDSGAAVHEFHEDRHEEFISRVMARGKRNSRGNYDARCLAHGGKGDTAVVYFPDTSTVHCNAGCNYAVLLAAEGLPAGHLPSRARAKPDGTGTGQWELPSPFDEFDLPTFPVETLPPEVRPFVEGLARETQTPVDLPAMVTLTVCSGAVAGRARIQARRGWVEPLNLYTVTSLPPANRKSAVFSASCEPLEEVEGELVEEARDDIARAASENRMLEERRNKLEKDAAKTDDAEERRGKQDEAVKIAQELAASRVPTAPRLIAADATPEVVATLLTDQGGRLCVFSPEGELFDLMAGRYSAGNANFDVFLKGHAGDPLRVDRRGRSEHVPRPALTIGLTVQPDVIRGLAAKQGFRGRGLLGRFQYSMPRTTVGSRQIAPKPLSGVVQQDYKSCIKALARLKPAEGSDEATPARMLHLTSEADSLLRKFEAEIEPQLSEDGALGTMTDWAGKLAGAVVRIAGVLHLADHARKLDPWPEQVAAETLSRAIDIGRYLIPHARAAFAEMGADPQVENAKHVLRWIERSRQTGFTKREAHQALKGRFKKVTDLEPALKLLEEHGYVRPQENSAGRKPGRRPSQAFDVNPHLFSCPHNTHNLQNYELEESSEDCEDSEGGMSDDLPTVPVGEALVLEEIAAERERFRI